MAELEIDVLYEDSDDEAAFEQSELPYQSTTNEPTTVESVVGPQFHSTKKPLNKSERKHLVDLLRKTEVNALFKDILKQLRSELHFTVFEEHGKLLEMMCKHEAEVKRMCSILVHDFCDIYESCACGKEKYARFVLK